MPAAIHEFDHAFASAAHNTMVAARAVVSWEQRKLNPDAAQIETLSSLIPVYGPGLFVLPQPKGLAGREREATGWDQLLISEVESGIQPGSVPK